MVKGQRGTTLLELMVVMALWSGLLVLILGFYISATQISRRHDKISDSYRKVHEILESVDALLSRSRVYSLNKPDEPANVCFARPLEGLSVSTCGQRIFQAPETLALEKAPEDTSPPTSAGIPLLGQLSLVSSKTEKRVVYKLELGWMVAIYPLKPALGAPKIPGNQYVLVLDIKVPVPKAGPAPKSVDDIKSPDIKRFERLILLENGKVGGSL